MICSRCVMDESDPTLRIGANGECNKCDAHYHEARSYTGKNLKQVFDFIKNNRRGEYDAVLGLSGGVDSSYTYHLARSYGLNLYLTHLDNGWDTPISVENMRVMTEYWGDELHVTKANLDQIQRSFFEAGLPDIEVPTDHAIRAILLEAAKSTQTEYILSGANYATESHAAWTHGHRDWRYIENVAKDAEMPHYSIWDDAWASLCLQWVKPLNYLSYHREESIEELQRIYGWASYGGKHQESIITRFVHGYILANKFKIDTRRSRLSAMICSGQITRDEALAVLRLPAYPLEEMLEDRKRVCRRWGIPETRFEAVMSGEVHTFRDYPSYASNPVYLPPRALIKVMGNRLGAKVMR